MTLSTPRWWYQKHPGPQVARFLLWPLSLVWAKVTAHRLKTTPSQDAGLVVISIGNLTMGGSGKTPIVRETLRLLRQDTISAHGLSRGYGGKLVGPQKVNPHLHDAAEVGDEPLMLSKDGPFWIAKDRVLGARAAAKDGAKVLVLDDGHQNPSLKKTRSLIVVDGETRAGEWPFGSYDVFPAGPMREPLKDGLARANGVIILLPTGLESPDPQLLALFRDKPVFLARLEAERDPPPGRQIGFAGIAKPWKVERALKQAGCDLIGFEAFPDHAPLSDEALTHLWSRAEQQGAGLVTTEKDWARLPRLWRGRITPWPIRARFEDEAGFVRFLKAALPEGGEPDNRPPDL